MGEVIVVDQSVTFQTDSCQVLDKRAIFCFSYMLLTFVYGVGLLWTTMES